MRIGLLGPAEQVPNGDPTAAFREATLFLLGDAEADQIVYLGTGEFAQRQLDAWAREIGGDDPEAGFLDKVAEIAPQGTPDAIESLLMSDASLARLAAVRKLPPPPARAVEMLEDRMVLFVHDKAVLDEEDIANAHLIVYGRSSEADLRRFGRRAFFTPGPLARGCVGMLESGDDGVTVALWNVSGAPVWREAISAGKAKLTVAT